MSIMLLHIASVLIPLWSLCHSDLLPATGRFLIPPQRLVGRARQPVRAVIVQNESDSGWFRGVDGAHGVTRQTSIAGDGMASVSSCTTSQYLIACGFDRRSPNLPFS